MVGWNALAWVMVVVLGAAIGCTKEDGPGGAGSSAGSGAVSGSGGAGTGGSGGGTPAPSCESTEQCDDGLFCNGDEVCEAGRCAPGTPLNCDDGIDCTVDQCDESRNACDSAAPDRDQDGHADATCLDNDEQPLGDDCDDSDSTRYPGALEVCDADDHDEDCDTSTFGRVDADGDGYLNANCCNARSDGSLLCGNDCDDANARVHPSNTESCDGLDNDCNGLLDHPKEDQDQDGHAASACGGTDCDDFDPLTYAGAMERCDGFDNDCLQGGGVAEDETDLDTDNFVAGVCMHMSEEDLSPGDCDEDRRSANPMRQELCNGKDDDCDGATDEMLSCASAVKQVTTGYLQTCAVRVDGTVACWGRNDDGALGTGSDDWVLDYPRNVIDTRNSDLRLSQVKQVAVGRFHNCAVHLDGRVSCWGDNVWGALGIGSDESGVQLPTTLEGIDDAEEVCAGDSFGCVRRTDGSVWCWGRNGFGQIGDAEEDLRTRAAQVTGLEPSIDIACGDMFACAVGVSGVARCWGDNRHGQLGDISRESSSHPVPVFGVETATSVSASASHACALLRSGHVMCWGDNAFGQIGNGFEGGDVLRAVQVTLYTGYALSDVVSIAAGGGDADPFDNILDDTGNTCARLRNGAVQCWGLNGDAQLGYGERINGAITPARVLSPRYPVQELPETIELSIAHQHGCAIAPDGVLRCWGGGEGQIPGFGSTPTPTVIEGL